MSLAISPVTTRIIPEYNTMIAPPSQMPAGSAKTMRLVPDTRHPHADTIEFAHNPYAMHIVGSHNPMAPIEPVRPRSEHDADADLIAKQRWSAPMRHLDFSMNGLMRV